MIASLVESGHENFNLFGDNYAEVNLAIEIKVTLIYPPKCYGILRKIETVFLHLMLPVRISKIKLVFMCKRLVTSFILVE